MTLRHPMLVEMLITHAMVAYRGQIQMMPIRTPASHAPARSRRHGRLLPPLRTITALVMREMSTRYGRSPGGYLWAILDPLGMIVLMGVGFSLLMHKPPIGSSFLLFMATGMMPFNMFNGISGVMARALMFSKPLLMYPGVTWGDALLARLILNAMTGLLVAWMIMTGVVIWEGVRIIVDIRAIALSMGLAILLGAGIGCLNCYLFMAFPVWEHAWSILTRPLFMVSGIFFLVDAMPMGVRDMLWYNPVAHLIVLMREGFHDSYQGSFASPLYVLAVSLVPLLVGLLLLWRHHLDLLNT